MRTLPTQWYCAQFWPWPWQSTWQSCINHVILTLTLENLLAGKTGYNKFKPVFFFRSERHVEKSPDEFGENRKKYSNSNTEITKLFKEKSLYKIKKRKGVTFFSIWNIYMKKTELQIKISKEYNLRRWMNNLSCCKRTWKNSGLTGNRNLAFAMTGRKSLFWPHYTTGTGKM